MFVVCNCIVATVLQQNYLTYLQIYYYTCSKTRLLENVFTLTPALTLILSLTLILTLTLTFSLKRNNVSD